MPKHLAPFALAALTFAAGAPALADHNSPHGAGWARMPNDIHNTRIDTLGDNTTFRDFVRQGNGASSVNRYLSDVQGSRQRINTRSFDTARGGMGRGRR